MFFHNLKLSVPSVQIKLTDLLTVLVFSMKACSECITEIHAAENISSATMAVKNQPFVLVLLMLSSFLKSLWCAYLVESASFCEFTNRLTMELLKAFESMTSVSLLIAEVTLGS